MAITPLVWMATVVVFILIIFRDGGSIGGWNYWEMISLLGIHELIFLGSWFLFIGNLNRFIQEINLGKFDRILLRPVNHRFLVSFNSVDLTTIAGILNAFLMFFLSLSKLKVDISLGRWFLFLISFFSAYLILYFIYFLVSSLSLFFVNAETFVDWLIEATDFDRYPAEIYGEFFRFFLLFALPVLFFAYVPSAILLGKLPWYYSVFGIIIVTLLYLISTLVWRAGLKKYQSASS
jgi:ABC-2 type transport system permease protein